MSESIDKKDSLLSLFGSMSPKGKENQKEWDVIRKEAKEERTNERLKK